MNLDSVWISRVPGDRFPPRNGQPLSGLTFAIKDNIDLAGLPTTAACPAYAYSPAQSAPVVQRLIDAGAVPLGKTNMDQFATGLVGTRSPYGACSSVFDERHISGGSSSGSAVAVASGQVNFALGTDTAGSGRVPAAFNNLVGLKPTRGLLSTSGVVPACRSIDCVTILTRTAAEASKVFEVARGFDPTDPYSRVPTAGQGAAPWASAPFRFGVPAARQLEFFGDDEAAALYRKAIADLEAVGGTKVEIDFALFRAAADLLYAGPWVAERLAAIGPFLEKHAGEMNPIVRDIIAGARRFTAVDAFNAEYKLRELRRATESEWARMDVLVLPTTGTIYTHDAVAADPVRLNTNLGYYTNFVNLLDLAAVAIPAGFRPNGLPFGISLIGPAFTDLGLLALAARYLRETVDPSAGTAAPGCIAVAVLGAHLGGQPLNWQLTQRGARLLKICRTAPGYRFYAIEGAIPKPGLIREESFAGPGIEVEVWAVPEDQFGSFVAGVPAPLGIGNAILDNRESVKCFICEPYAVAGALEITPFGGWRKYLESKR
jgi:allophanate hydrolase